VDGTGLTAYISGNPVKTTDPYGDIADSESDGTTSECEYCGPEMLPSVVLTLARVREDIKDIGLLNRWFPILFPWDFHFPVNKLPECQTKKCVECITMNGIKQRTWDVNYILFGCLLQETASNVGDGLNTAWAWKHLKRIGNEYDCQLERWIWIGFTHCKYGAPISNLLGLKEDEPYGGPSFGDMNGENNAVGCPITDDPLYDKCKPCVMDYELPIFFD